MTSFGGVVQPLGTVSVQGRTGEDVRLGTPTDGDLDDGLAALEATDSVVDAIDKVNEAALAVDTKNGGDIDVGTPTDGDYTDGELPIVSSQTIADAVDALNVGLKAITDSVGALVDRVGWIRVVDVTVSGGTVTSKAYLDPPNNTILQSAAVSSGTFSVVVEASYPTIEINAVPSVLPLVGSVYRGAVEVTLAADGDVVCQAFDADGGPGGVDTIAITLELPPTITAAVFTGGKPGTQSELKAGDTVSLDVTADKDFDAVEVISGAGLATTSEVIPVATGLNATVAVEIADQGTTPQALPARVRVIDAVTAAPSASYDTDTAGTTEDVHVVTINNLYPTHSFGLETYPPSQGALKGAESATVASVQSDFDTIAYDANGTGQLAVTNPNTAEATKTVTRAGGSYNVEGDGGVANLRATLTRNANDAETVTTAIVNIANVAATVTVAEATARVRSGPAPGNDTTITIAADQELVAAPSLDPAASRGAFVGLWAGGSKTWTRALRVPDAENPADGSLNTWINLVATNLAGIVTSVISGNDSYVVGGFTVRTLNFAAFTANSAETVPLTDQAKLAAGSYSNGNPAVIQPAGTADTTDVGKEGWTAPLAASGVSVGLRMLHSPTVAANTGGLTLASVEETV